MVHTLFEFLFLFYLPKATIKLHFLSISIVMVFYCKNA